jgi:hypothetical protein
MSVSGMTSSQPFSGADQFLASVTLPAIRCIARLQAGGQNGAGVGAGATGNGCIDELDVGIFLAEHFDHRI